MSLPISLVSKSSFVINSIGLFTQKEALSIMRDYDIEKKKIIKVAFKKFENYKISIFS